MLAYSNKVVAFDGVNEYVTMGDVLGFERTDSFSISLWVKATSVGYIVAKREGSPYRGYGIYQDTSTVHFFLTNTDPTNQLSVNAPLAPDGKWHHIVWTYNGNSLPSGCACYVDGVGQTLSVYANSLTDTIINTAAFILACRTGVSQFLTGRLDEVAVYNRALSATEASWIYNSGIPRDLSSPDAPLGVKAWWRLGEIDTYPTISCASGLDVPAVYPDVWDFSGNGYNGSMIIMGAGAITLDAPGRDKSVLFGGTNEYVTMGNVFGFERTDAFSFSFWFKTSASGSWQGLISKNTAGPAYTGYQVTMDSTGHVGLWLEADDSANNHLYVVTSAAYNNGSWHHCTITYSGTSLASGVLIYIDGSVVSTTSSHDTLTSSIANSASFMLGSREAADIWYIGSLDEVSIYSKTLTAAEVTWIFNSGKPRPLTDSGCPTNLAAWWRMGDGDTFYVLKDSGPGGTPPEFPFMHDISGSSYHGAMIAMSPANIVSDSPGGAYSTKCTLWTEKYVEMGNVLDYEKTDSWSVSFWCRGGDVASSLMSKRLEAAPWTGWMVSQSYGQLHVWLTNSVTTNELEVSFGSGLNDGTWHHVVVTFNGTVPSGIKCYIDGSSMTQTLNFNTLTGLITNAGPFRLGGGYGTSQRLDEMAVYDRELTSVEVNWIRNGGIPRALTDSGCPTGLVGWWRMGEPLASGKFDGLMANMEWNDIRGDRPGSPAHSMRCLAFAGSNERVNCGNVTAFDRFTPFSVSAWVRTVAAGGCVVAKSDNSTKGWYLETTGGEAIFYLLITWPTNVLYAVSQGGTLNDGKWHHVVATYTGSGAASGIAFYIDGAPITVVVGLDLLSGSVTHSEPVTIGYRGLAYPNSYVGNIDEVALYSRVLTPAEASWLYNSGAPKDLRFSVGSPPNLVAWWRLGEGKINGTMTNMEAGDIVEESIAGYGGLDAPLDFYGGDIGGFDGCAANLGGSSEVTYYKMRAQDSGATPPGYVTWVVAGSADFAGAGYAGATPTPVGSMVAGSATVVGTWVG